MRIRTAIVVSIAAVVVATATPWASDQSPDQKLQQAIDLIESKGDLRQARPLLEEAAKSPDRAVAARALLYLAQVQERTDGAAARRTLDRITKEFADQRDPAAAARARRALLAQPSGSEAPVDRLVLSNNIDFFPSSMVTRDGRSLLFPDYATGGPAIRDLATGRVTYLTDGPAAQVIAPRLSPDGTRVSYEWAGSVNGRVRQEIRVVRAQPGSTPQTIWPSAGGPGDVREAIPREWSADGTSLLVDLNRKDDTWQYAWMDINDGSVRVLASSDWRRPDDPGDRRPSLSPDGRYLAYSALVANPARPEAPAPGTADERVYILAVDGSGQVELTHTAGINRQPIWTADGSHVLFQSGRAGTIDLWGIEVERGKPKGEPILIQREIGLVRPIGMTSDGRFYYVKSVDRQQELVVTSVASLQETASRASEPLFSSLFTGPTWSPDGKSLAVLRAMPDGRTVLVVRTLETGEERRFVPPGRAAVTGGSALWLRDGSGLIVSVAHPDLAAPGDPRTQVRSLFRADLKSREMTELTSLGRFTGRGAFSLMLAPDDQTLYVVGAFAPPATMQPPFRSVTAVDLVTAERRTVVDLPPGPLAIAASALSPDGRTFALVVMNTQTLQTRLVRVGADGREYHEFKSVLPAAGTLGGMVRWTPDSKSILFASGVPGRPHRLLRIASDTGASQSLGEVEGLTAIDIDPSGNRLVMSKSGPTSELHVMLIVWPGRK